MSYIPSDLASGPSPFLNSTSTSTSTSTLWASAHTAQRGVVAQLFAIEAAEKGDEKEIKMPVHMNGHF
ncbi:hypothetical protein [Hafnia psychrotolerans]|jgi:hypothetical protein|uniref:hypothetical protein n=1 Tax=Hafnia psychrotolerans TaxID=1477018 RepID=UPI00166AF22E|nr:hypothetical protein [Hafnia psychrotolerans]